jgi:hypothetical protein
MSRTPKPLKAIEVLPRSWRTFALYHKDAWIEHKKVLDKIVDRARAVQMAVDDAAKQRADIARGRAAMAGRDGEVQDVDGPWSKLTLGRVRSFAAQDITRYGLRLPWFDRTGSRYLFATDGHRAIAAAVPIATHVMERGYAPAFVPVLDLPDATLVAELTRADLMIGEEPPPDLWAVIPSGGAYMDITIDAATAARLLKLSPADLEAESYPINNAVAAVAVDPDGHWHTSRPLPNGCVGFALHYIQAMIRAWRVDHKATPIPMRIYLPLGPAIIGEWRGEYIDGVQAHLIMPVRLK